MNANQQRAANEAQCNAGMNGAKIATRTEAVNDTARLMSVLTITHTDGSPKAVSRPPMLPTGKPT